MLTESRFGVEEQVQVVRKDGKYINNIEPSGKEKQQISKGGRIRDQSENKLQGKDHHEKRFYIKPTQASIGK